MGEAAPRAPRRWRPTPLVWASGGLHLAAAGAVIAAPSSWPLAAGAVFADHVVLAAAGMAPRSRLLGPNLLRLESADAVALTFDDGPDPERTPAVLDRLEAAGARASFFCIGRRAERHPELVREIARRGHRVENHTWGHRNAFSMLPPRALGREIDRAQERLSELAGRPPAYLRPPAGVRSPWLEPLLARRGLHLAAWTRRGFDAVDGAVERVSRRLLRDLAGGDVLLLHDGRLVAADAGAPVLELLDRLLGAMERLGLRGRPLPEPEAG